MPGEAWRGDGLGSSRLSTSFQIERAAREVGRRSEMALVRISLMPPGRRAILSEVLELIQTCSQTFRCLTVGALRWEGGVVLMERGGGQEEWKLRRFSAKIR